MEKSKEFPVAEMTPRQVEDIRGLERRLTQEQGKNVVLIAYEDTTDK